MVSLCCGLNLLFKLVKIPSVVLHLSCSTCVNDLGIVGLTYLANFRDYYLFCLWHTIYLKTLFTFSLKFLSSLYLSTASQLNVGCFILGQPSLGLHFMFFLFQPQPWAVLLFLLLQTQFCTVATLVFVCSLAIICSLFAYVCLYDTFTPDTM